MIARPTPSRGDSRARAGRVLGTARPDRSVSHAHGCRAQVGESTPGRSGTTAAGFRLQLHRTTAVACLSWRVTPRDTPTKSVALLCRRPVVCARGYSRRTVTLFGRDVLVMQVQPDGTGDLHASARLWHLVVASPRPRPPLRAPVGRHGHREHARELHAAVLLRNRQRFGAAAVALAGPNVLRALFPVPTPPTDVLSHRLATQSASRASRPPPVGLSLSRGSCRRMVTVQSSSTGSRSEAR